MDSQLPQPGYVNYQQPKPRSKTWLWVLLVILLVTGTAACVYFWQQGNVDSARREASQQQTQQEESQPQAVQAVDFTAPNLPFTFKRPADWTVQTEAPVSVDQTKLEGSYGITMYAPGTVEVGGAIGGTEISTGATIVISVNQKPQQKSVNEIRNIAGFSSTHKDITDVTVASQPALEYLYAFEGPKRVYTQFFKDGTQYTIYYETKRDIENLKTSADYKVYQDLVKSFAFK